MHGKKNNHKIEHECRELAEDPSGRGRASCGSVRRGTRRPVGGQALGRSSNPPQDRGSKKKRMYLMGRHPIGPEGERRRRAPSGTIGEGFGNYERQRFPRLPKALAIAPGGSLGPSPPLPPLTPHLAPCSKFPCWMLGTISPLLSEPWRFLAEPNPSQRHEEGGE